MDCYFWSKVEISGLKEILKGQNDDPKPCIHSCDSQMKCSSRYYKVTPLILVAKYDQNGVAYTWVCMVLCFNKVSTITPTSLFALVWSTPAAYGTCILESIVMILKEFSGELPNLWKTSTYGNPVQSETSWMIWTGIL